jgi:hypothetical protein
MVSTNILSSPDCSPKNLRSASMVTGLLLDRNEGGKAKMKIREKRIYKV